MTTTSALILGIVQGLTEFLPVSSTAHLILVPQFLHISLPTVAFDVMLHLATACAVLIYFGKDIWQILRKDRKMIGLLIVGSIPTGIIGLLFKDFFESFFHGGAWIGLFLIITGFLLWFAEKWSTEKKGLVEMGWLDAVVIGICQGLAILPGISRSGSTVAAALGRGLNKTFAAKFALLLSVPAILGAGVLKAKEISHIPLQSSVIGFIAAFFSGLLAIKLFIRLIQTRNIRVFSWYCWLVGFIVIYTS